MSNEISMQGVGGMKTVTMLGKALGKDDKYEAGMALTLTGANELGFGVAAGSPAFGIVTKVESDGKLGAQTKGFTESAKMTSVAANRPAVGDWAYCNANGEVIKPPATLTGAPRAVVTAIDTTNHTATISL